jgi:hypothetical protein
MDQWSVKGVALALGVSCAIYMLLLGWAGMLGWGADIVNTIGTFYIGFAPTLLGGIIGAVWGFLDGAIGGAIIAIIYNLSARKK